MTKGNCVIITMDKECQRGSKEGTAIATRTKLQAEGS